VYAFGKNKIEKSLYYHLKRLHQVYERWKTMSIVREKDVSKKERQVNHLVNLVEKQTRTQRYLEGHFDNSSSLQNLEHAKQLNQERLLEINNLKNILAYGNNVNNNYKLNTEKRLLYTEGYLNHNADHMSDQSFKNAKVKQENRKNQLDQFKI